MRTKNSFINSLVNVISLIILSVLGFISTKVFIYYLGIEYNGLNGTFSNILSILAITELGFSGAITYSLYKPIVKNDIESISSIMLFFRKAYRIIGIIIFILSLIVSLFIGVFLKDSTLSIGYIRLVFLLFAVNTSISYFYSYNRNLFYAYQKNYVVIIIDFIFRTTKILLQVISLCIWKNYILFLLINIIFTTLANIVIHFYAKKCFKDIKIENAVINKNISKEITASVKNLSIIQILSSSINFTDNLIISSFISIITAGLYVNYNLLFSQIQKVVIGVFSSVGASIGNLIAENKKDRIKVVFVNLEYVAFILASFCVCCFSFLTQLFVSDIWLSNTYLLSTSILIVLIFNFYMTVQQQPINYFLSGSGLFKKMILPLTIQSIVNIVLSIVLAIKIGLVGVFIGTTVSGIICWIMNAKIICKEVNDNYLKYFLRQLLFIVLNIIYIFILSTIFKVFVPSNAIVRLLYILLWCIIVPNLINFLLIYYNNETKYLKGLLLKIVKKMQNKEKK